MGFQVVPPTDAGEFVFVDGLYLIPSDNPYQHYLVDC